MWYSKRWIVCAGLLAAGCGHQVPPKSHADVFALGDRTPWSTKENDMYSFPGVRLDTLTGAAETALVETALNSLMASCEGLEERVMWLECSESPCHVYVWGSDPVPGADYWADVTCQDREDMLLHGAFRGIQAQGGLQMIAAGVFAVRTDNALED